MNEDPAADERQLAECGRLQNGERHRGLFESLTEGFALHEVLFDAEGNPIDLRYLAVNPAFERHTGFKAEDILGRTVSALFANIEPVWIEHYRKVALTGEPVRFEAWCGALRRWFEASVFRPEPGRLGAVLSDISARKRTEEETAWLASFPERNSNPIAEIAPAAGEVPYVNPAGRRLFPDLLERGLSHPWLAGLEAVAETLAKGGGDSVLREVMVGGRCYAQSVYYLAEKQRLRVYGIDVTQRKRAEEALRESEAALRAFFDSPGVMRGFVELVDGDIVHLSCNAAAAELFGADPAIVPGLSASETGAPDDLVRPWVALYEESQRTGQPVSKEYARRGADGRDRWLLATVCYLGTGRSGNPRFAYTALDLTERRRMEEALRESEERYRMLFDTLIEGFCIIEVIFDAANQPIDYRFLEINPAFEAQTGLKDARGKLMRELAPDHEAHWFEIYGQVALTGQPARFVNEARALNRWFDVSAYRVGGPESRRVAILFNDITKRKHAEDALSKQRQLLQVTLTSIGDAVLATDGRGAITFLNPVAAALTGWSEDAALGRPAQDVLRMVNENTREEAEDIIGRVLREGRVVAMANHTALLSRDGREIPIEDSAAPIRDEAGSLLGVVLVFHDVTEKRRAQEALRESESRLTRLIDNLPEGAVFRHCHGTGGGLSFEFVSAGIEQLTGIPAAEIMSDPSAMEESIVPEDRKRLHAIMKESRESLTPFEVAVRRKHRATGELRWSLVRATPSRNPDGSTAYDGIEIDITERQAAEEALRESRAMLAKRTVQLERAAAELEKRNREVERASHLKTDFLTRISHELRTPLNAIVGYSDLLGEQSAAGPLAPPYPRFVANIQEGARHLLAMVNDLLDISRIEAGRLDLNLERFQPAEALEDVLSVVTPLARAKNIAIEPQVPPGIYILADRTRFKQVLYNLLSNAVKFTPENGRVWIAEAGGGEEVGFCVGDTGIGIPESQLESIFDEFHRVGGSSGSASEGTGLGLAITRRLVELHGGSIRVESTAGQGSRFIFSLGPQSSTT